ncbi:MAG: hypothetical protein AAB368_13295 [bacterium]
MRWNPFLEREPNYHLAALPDGRYLMGCGHRSGPVPGPTCERGCSMAPQYQGGPIDRIPRWAALKRFQRRHGIPDEAGNLAMRRELYRMGLIRERPAIVADVARRVA